MLSKNFFSLSLSERGCKDNNFFLTDKLFKENFESFFSKPPDGRIFA